MSDKIYSRNRIKIPKFKVFYSENKKAKRFIKFITIILISLITFYTILKSTIPIFEGLCVEKVRNIATDIINKQSNKVLATYDYSNIVELIKNDANNTNAVKIDVITINKIASDIAIEAEQQFKNLENEKVSIPIGAITGNRYLLGLGPNINIRIIPTGNIITELKTEFKSKGINQTVYRIYLELTCKTNILTPYKTIQEEIINQVLLVETVIVGEVPETYYNLEGIKDENVIDIVE